MAVKFLRSWSIYNAGEIAGFDEELEEKLINQGIAVKVETKNVTAPTKDKMEKEPKVKK